MKSRNHAVGLLVVLFATGVQGQGSTPAHTPYREAVITSRELGDQRRIWIRLPANYGLHRRALPLTIVLDGDDRRLLDLAVAAAQYTNVLDAFDPDTPEQIVVGVESHQRGRDFGNNAPAMSRFLEAELLPMLSRTYRVAGPHVIVGHSLAGAFALDMMCRAPATIRAVVAVSPALADTSDAVRVKRCLTTLASSTNAPEHAVFLAVGARARDGTEEQFRPNIISVVESLKPLVGTGVSRLHIRLLELPDVSHARTPLSGFPAGLAFVNAEWGSGRVDSVSAAVLTGRMDPLVALDSLKALRTRRGDAGTLPARWYHIAALILNAGGKFADAARVARQAITLYPERLELYDALADACTKIHDSKCARGAALQGIQIAQRREDLAPFARDREINALRTRWLTKTH